MDRPLLIYDAQCAFCRKWIARWRARTGDTVDYRPFQEASLHRMTDRETRRRTGAWWHRELRGVYFPAVTRR